MKTKFFLLAGILSLALTACGGDDDNQGKKDNEIPENAKITFTKMANCPVAADLRATVYNGLIYFISDAGDFISYNPTKNEWKTLARTPESYYSNIFVWQDKLYWHGGSYNICVYNPVTDSWSKTEEIAPHNNYGMMFNIGNKLFLLFAPDSICLVYQTDTQQWKKLDDKTIASCADSFCQIYNMAYAISQNTIYQFDPETYTTTAKINTPSFSSSTYLSACLYKQRQMLYTKCYVSKIDETDIVAIIGIYIPSTNEYSEIRIDNEALNGVRQMHIPMPINRLTYIDGRIFVGPNNAAFYELKIK